MNTYALHPDWTIQIIFVFFLCLHPSTYPPFYHPSVHSAFAPSILLSIHPSPMYVSFSIIYLLYESKLEKSWQFTPNISTYISKECIVLYSHNTTITHTHTHTIDKSFVSSNIWFFLFEPKPSWLFLCVFSTFIQSRFKHCIFFYVPLISFNTGCCPVAYVKSNKILYFSDYVRRCIMQSSMTFISYDLEVTSWLIRFRLNIWGRKLPKWFYLFHSHEEVPSVDGGATFDCLALILATRSSLW